MGMNSRIDQGAVVVGYAFLQRGIEEVFGVYNRAPYYSLFILRYPLRKYLLSYTYLEIKVLAVLLDHEVPGRSLHSQDLGSQVNKLILTSTTVDIVF